MTAPMSGRIPLAPSTLPPLAGITSVLICYSPVVLAQASGMGLNAYFVYTVCIGLGLCQCVVLSPGRRPFHPADGDRPAQKIRRYSVADFAAGIGLFRVPRGCRTQADRGEHSTKVALSTAGTPLASIAELVTFLPFWPLSCCAGRGSVSGHGRRTYYAGLHTIRGSMMDFFTNMSFDPLAMNSQALARCLPWLQLCAVYRPTPARYCHVTTARLLSAWWICSIRWGRRRRLRRGNLTADAKFPNGQGTPSHHCCRLAPEAAVLHGFQNGARRSRIAMFPAADSVSTLPCITHVGVLMMNCVRDIEDLV